VQQNNQSGHIPGFEYSVTATLETSGASPGIITVTCTTDQQGGATASATTNVFLQSMIGSQALTNFQFTDSVGADVDLAYSNSVYATQFPQICSPCSILKLNITATG
jgi:hypothetical protein